MNSGGQRHDVPGLSPTLIAFEEIKDAVKSRLRDVELWVQSSQDGAPADVRQTSRNTRAILRPL